jgi:hypothetical protein
LKDFLPKDDLAMLDENFQVNNLPRIGSDDNTAFPGGQINLAEAIGMAASDSMYILLVDTIHRYIIDYPFSIWTGQHGYLWQAPPRRARRCRVEHRNGRQQPTATRLRGGPFPPTGNGTILLVTISIGTDLLWTGYACRNTAHSTRWQRTSQARRTLHDSVIPPQKHAISDGRQNRAFCIPSKGKTVNAEP